MVVVQTKMDTNDDDQLLRVAAMKGDISAVERLVMNGANLNAPENYTHYPPLVESTCNRHPSVTKLLLLNKADPNILTKLGNTSIYFANKQGYTEIVKLLLDARATPE